MALKRKSRSITPSSNAKKPKAEQVLKVEEEEEDIAEEPVVLNEEDEDEEDEVQVKAVENVTKGRARSKNVKEKDEYEGECLFTSEPMNVEDANRQWPHRYLQKKVDEEVDEVKIVKSNEDEEDEPILARRHFTQAKVDGQIYNLFDDAYVKADNDEDPYICKIVELFESEDGSLHFSAQWFYRAKDTVIGDWDSLIDEKCIFFSEVKNDNPLNCLLKKLKIVKVSSKADLEYKKNVRDTCDYYYEKNYLLPCTSFVSVSNDEPTCDDKINLSNSTDSDGDAIISEAASIGDKTELVLMDLYSGCGAMSTGLCLGANRGGVKLTTKWAIDINKHACDSLRFNHPETQVRNEPAEDFLSLLKEWCTLCASYSLIGDGTHDQHIEMASNDNGKDNGGKDIEDEEEEDDDDDGEVYEVDEILEICYGDPKKIKENGLHFKISWKGYGPEHNTWEPIECLSGCPEKLKEFVVQGFKSKLLPLPGDVDVICGGPPCQGISGFNRFRNLVKPLEDEKNKQLTVFMDIVAFLKPKYVLMENVVDIIKLVEGYLGKYAIGRLVGLGYQARMGLMAAGCYGLPQFRMRVFLWAALPTEKLPQYPLPSHKVVMRGFIPSKFEANVVAHDEGHNVLLENELLLEDALSDLPPVKDNEIRDVMEYDGKPKTSFQRFIRQKEVMLGSNKENSEGEVLYDHRPLKLSADDYERVCKIPMEKGACFRNLPGVLVGSDNKVFFDPKVTRAYLSSGKPVVPDYAMNFVRGTSTKPFGRLWWDETVPTVITRAQPHNHRILHPTQNRVLTIRENARLQGFPDYYKFSGPVKERYMQVGNAVAVPVARALGYCLGLASKGDTVDDQPLLSLPSNFYNIEELNSPAESS